MFQWDDDFRRKRVWCVYGNLASVYATIERVIKNKGEHKPCEPLSIPSLTLSHNFAPIPIHANSTFLFATDPIEKYDTNSLQAIRLRNTTRGLRDTHLGLYFSVGLLVLAVCFSNHHILVCFFVRYPLVKKKKKGYISRDLFHQVLFRVRSNVTRTREISTISAQKKCIFII